MANWRQGVPPTSGGVKLSLVRDQRSKPPPFWEPRKSPVLPDEPKIYPFRSSEPFQWSNSYRRAQAADQTPTQRAPFLKESPSPTDAHEYQPVTRSTPSTPPSEPLNHRIHLPTSPRMGESQSTIGSRLTSVGQLSPTARAFVPSQRTPPTVGTRDSALATPGDIIDLNEYMKRNAGSSASSATVATQSSSPSRAQTPIGSDSEDAESQWLDQARAQQEASPSAESQPYREETADAQDESTRGTASASVPSENDQKTSFARALSKARMIQNLSSVTYPVMIERPDPWLNLEVRVGKFCYDRNFLMQFMPICTDKPSALLRTDSPWLNFCVGSATNRRRGSVLEGASAPRPSVPVGPKTILPAICGECIVDAELPPREDRFITAASPAREVRSTIKPDREPSSASGASAKGDASPHAANLTCSSPTEVEAGLGVPVCVDTSAVPPGDTTSKTCGCAADDRMRDLRIRYLEAQAASLAAQVDMLRLEIAQLRELPKIS